MVFIAICSSNSENCSTAHHCTAHSTTTHSGGTVCGYNAVDVVVLDVVVVLGAVLDVAMLSIVCVASCLVLTYKTLMLFRANVILDVFYEPNVWDNLFYNEEVTYLSMLVSDHQYLLCHHHLQPIAATFVKNLSYPDPGWLLFALLYCLVSHPHYHGPTPSKTLNAIVEHAVDFHISASFLFVLAEGLYLLV